MKQIVMLAAVAALIATPALAQKQETAAGALVETKAAGKDSAKMAAASKKGSRRLEDARHCLDRKINVEIIKCAEQYL
jgi:hypothetical protein